MSEDHRRPVQRSPRRQASRSVAPPQSAVPNAPARSGEVAALVHLAELDVAPERVDERRRPARDRTADERRALGARLSSEVVEAYDRARRAGRQPPVVRLVSSICSGCHVRLPTTLDQKIRRVRGVGACPHCLRLVYDPDWLSP